jgi:hypothetical protein
MSCAKKLPVPRWRAVNGKCTIASAARAIIDPHQRINAWRGSLKSLMKNLKEGWDIDWLAGAGRASTPRKQSRPGRRREIFEK